MNCCTETHFCKVMLFFVCNISLKYTVCSLLADRVCHFVYVHPFINYVLHICFWFLLEQNKTKQKEMLNKAIHAGLFTEMPLFLLFLP